MHTGGLNSHQCQWTRGLISPHGHCRTGLGRGFPTPSEGNPMAGGWNADWPRSDTWAGAGCGLKRRSEHFATPHRCKTFRRGPARLPSGYHLVPVGGLLGYLPVRCRCLGGLLSGTPQKRRAARKRLLLRSYDRGSDQNFTRAPPMTASKSSVGTLKGWTPPAVISAEKWR
jgi:hypothetical protein